MEDREFHYRTLTTFAEITLAGGLGGTILVGSFGLISGLFRPLAGPATADDAWFGVLAGSALMAVFGYLVRVWFNERIVLSHDRLTWFDYRGNRRLDVALGDVAFVSGSGIGQLRWTVSTTAGLLHFRAGLSGWTQLRDRMSTLAEKNRRTAPVS